MENRQVKELMVAMGRSGVKKLRIKRGDFEVEIEREQEEQSLPVSRRESSSEGRPSCPDQVKSSLSHESRALEPSKPKVAPEAEENGVDLHFVTSPMVGVFYPAPSPEDPPFVQPGQKVQPDTVLCIVEAMKVMNEVKAGVSGELKESLVEKGHPVEFGTKLFTIVATS